MVNFLTEISSCNKDTKSYDPIVVETLCILLGLRSEVALKHVVSVDSQESRFGFVTFYFIPLCRLSISIS